MAAFEHAAPRSGAWRGLLALLVLAAGVLQAGALAWPWAAPLTAPDGTVAGAPPLWWLQLLSLAVLCAVLLRTERPAQAAWWGGLFATAWLSATFWWLFISMHVYGGLAAPLAAAAVLALAAFLASYYAIASWLFCRFKSRGQARAALFFVALWTLAEMARGTLWTGFPWGAGGYAHVEGPLAPLARWVGVYGVGAAAAAVAMLLAQGLHVLRMHPRQRLAWLAAWTLVLLVCAAATVARTRALDDARADGGVAAAAARVHTLALLQGNIPQDEKFQPGSGVPLALAWYAEALRSTPARMVVAPETAVPLLPQQLMPGYMDGLREHFARGEQAALVGVPLGDAEQGYTNSVLGWAPEAAEYQYDKHHLVPFGEFIPPLFRWFTAMMNIPLGDFNRGAVGQASMAWAGERWAPNICYEDLFGEELAARFDRPETSPTVFVNVSNIAWFGDSVAIDQHLSISRMRALEFERPMVRATNTGATAVIDHRGQVTHALPRLTRDVLLADVQGRGGPDADTWAATPFARWAAPWGLAPAWMAMGLLALACARWRQRSRGRGRA
ncbi:apolipoprotein N-acyltransferase [Acidovorax lacteus]|uniref:Apolipoprotein N-acyltransferase n=1 Tax=Acidovorax lacteus TaxID=1924988 RepID=A0ABP8KYP2_9BURK